MSIFHGEWDAAPGDQTVMRDGRNRIKLGCRNDGSQVDLQFRVAIAMDF
jgi:hypothetical protein